MKLQKKYRYNYLLISAVVIFCTFLVIFLGFFSEDEIKNSPNRFNSNASFISFIFSALIFAPVFEEIIFRGFFTKNKLLKITSIVGLPLIILLFKNHSFLLVAAPYVALLVINFFKEQTISKHLLFLYSAFIFALAHYELAHFSHLITILPILSQFSLGLLLIWIVLNFNIKKAIIVHFIFNFLAIMPVFISLQFPDKVEKSLEYKSHKITWVASPALSTMKKFIKPNLYEFSAVNYTALDIYLSYDSKNKPNLRNSEMFVKYKLSIEKLNDEAVKLDSVTIKEIFLKAGLLIKS